MRVDFNLHDKCTKNQAFQMRYIEEPSVRKYINHFNFADQKKAVTETVDLIRNYVSNFADGRTLTLGHMPANKASLVNVGTYDEYFINGKSTTLKTSNNYKRENFYIQIDDNKMQGFYINPDENPSRVASWFIETFNFYREGLKKIF